MPNKVDHPFKNHKMPLPMRLFFTGTTWTFKVLGAVSPKLAGRLALRLFMTPTRFPTPRKEKPLRESAKLEFYTIRDRQISVRSWGDENAPTVLLSHGWGGRSSQFHAFIGPLVEAGYRVVGFEIPGHGDSTGKHTNMLDVSSILAEVAKKQGPLKAIIGHSFGCGTTLLAMDRYGVDPEKIVLVSCFRDVCWITEIFGEVFGMRESTLEAMRQLAQKKFAHTYGPPWTFDEISPINTLPKVKVDIFMIHDDQDHEVPYEQPLELHSIVPHAKFLTTSGFGHRKILMNKECVQATLDFIQNK